MIDIQEVLKDSLRLYFAPLVGAIRGVIAEMKRIDRKNNRAS